MGEEHEWVQSGASSEKMSGCGGKKKTEGKGLGSGSPLPFFCGRGGRRRGERGNLSILRFLLLFPSFCLFLFSSCPDVAIFISISEKVGGGDRAWEGKNYGKGKDQCLSRIRHGNSSSRDTKGPTLYLATGKRVLDRKALDRTILKLDRFFSV